MRSCSLLFLLLPFFLLAEPTEEDRRLAEIYKNYDIDLTGLTPTRVWTSQNLYHLEDGTAIWVHNSGHKTIRTKDSIEIRIAPGGKWRTVTLPSGRRFYYYHDDRVVEWTLLQEEAPDFVLKSVRDDGKTIQLSKLRGQVVLLNFWASYCEYCKAYLPETQQLHEKYRSNGLVVIGISIDREQSNAKKAAEEWGLTFDVVLAEPKAQTEAFRMRSLPQVFLIDKKGIIRYSYVVMQDEEIIETCLKEE
jgi:peroxiredoxin